MINDSRRATRRHVSDPIAVFDAMSDGVVGRLGNVSEIGLLLIASAPLVEDALYQFRFSITDDRGREVPVEVGAHLLWADRASAPGQAWAGFRILTLGEHQLPALRAWIGRAPHG